MNMMLTWVSVDKYIENLRHYNGGRYYHLDDIVFRGSTRQVKLAVGVAEFS